MFNLNLSTSDGDGMDKQSATIQIVLHDRALLNVTNYEESTTASNTANNGSEIVENGKTDFCVAILLNTWVYLLC